MHVFHTPWTMLRVLETCAADDSRERYLGVEHHPAGIVRKAASCGLRYPRLDILTNKSHIELKPLKNWSRCRVELNCGRRNGKPGHGSIVPRSIRDAKYEVNWDDGRILRHRQQQRYLVQPRSVRLLANCKAALRVNVNVANVAVEHDACIISIYVLHVGQNASVHVQIHLACGRKSK